MSKTYVQAYNCSVTLPHILAALAKAELHWEMHRAQVMSLDILTACFAPTVVVSELETKTEVKIPAPINTTFTLLGIDVKVNNEYPRSLIRLMWGDRELSRIEGLAVPMAMGYNGPDFDADLASETAKFQKLTY